MDWKIDKKRMMPLIICGALFVGALGMEWLFGNSPRRGASVGQSGVVISEVMSDNVTYVDGSGRALDYIEISNLTDSAVNISNYKLSDDESTIGYTFPQGTVLQPYGSAVCWCDDQGGSEYGNFGISRKGGETIYLYNSANVIVDEQTIPALGENQSYIRMEDGTWTVSGLASPGFANTQEGNAQWLESVGCKPVSIVISEVQTTAQYTRLDGEGTVCDWIELYNFGDTAVVLDGAYLTDEATDLLKWQIPKLTLEPQEYALIRCGGQTPADANFSLSSKGGTLILTGSLGNLIHSLDFPGMDRDTTWAMDSNGEYGVSVRPTPGFANTDEGYNGWLQSLGIECCPVIISEVQSANRSAILDADGNLSDWIELYNPGTEPVVLDGAFLTDEEADPFKWQITELTLAPGEYTVIPCTGKKETAAGASFSLSKSGCTVLLSGPVGNTIARLACPALEEDRSWQWVGEDTYVETEFFSPGFENTKDGYDAFRASQRVLGALAISEVMSSNDRYMLQYDGEYHDWVELKNISDQTIDLSDYAISDSSGDLLLFQLPQQQLEPGEMVIVICSGNLELTGRYIHAPFTLSRERCWVYLTHVEEGISDYVAVSGVPLMGSAGRMEGQNGIFYFATPTPGVENSGGAAEVTTDPFVETPDGIYDDVTEVEVVLSGEGQIYYTLDGSEPTLYSAQYTQPLILTETSVVRARSYSDGKLPSAVVTASYIINEHHTLPVISIAANPRSLFGSDGIYTNYTRDQEIACNITLFEGEGGFSANCGLELYGHTGLELPKKSFKVNFKSRYGESRLNYPVYGEDGPFLFDSLCIRAGQDYPQAIFRDELFTSLCADMGDAVLVQRQKHCILYVNGEYFGIYCMKEAFNELYYAQNRDVREESVEIVQAPVGYDTQLHEFFRFLSSADMTLDENYEYACSVMNIDSVIDWMIIEGYSTNGDVQQNLRYFRSTDNGNRYELAFYDLDWAFYFHLPFTDVLSSERESWQHLMLTQGLMKNPTFRQKFLQRLSDVLQTTLSTENVLDRIDYYHALLAPEVKREREKWGSSYDSWEWNVDLLREFLTSRDPIEEIVVRLERYIGLTAEEKETYFGRWIS